MTKYVTWPPPLPTGPFQAPHPNLPFAGSKSLPEERDDGLHVRLSRLTGQTPKGVLDSPLRFPAVVGENFDFDEGATHREYDTVAAGQFSQPSGGGAKARQLRVWQLEILSLDWDAAWLTVHNIRAIDLRNELYAVLRSKRPFQFLAAVNFGPDEHTELNCDATLRSITRSLRHGENDTRYYTLNFTEWRQPKTERRSADKGKRGKHRLPTTHRLKADTTFYGLAKLFYGSYDNWRVIAEENGLRKWGAKTPIVDTKRFKVGDKVKIPKPPAD